MQNLRNYRSAAVLDTGQTISTSNSEVFSKSEWTELVNMLSLSPRQAEVVQCLFCGRSDKQIAMDLQISVPTVRTHIGRLFSRFGVQDRTELVLHVFRQFRASYGRSGYSRL